MFCWSFDGGIPFLIDRIFSHKDVGQNCDMSKFLEKGVIREKLRGITAFSM